MATEIEPVVGNWYKDKELGRLFEVIAYDDEDTTINVQYFESELAEFDIDVWSDMTLEIAAEPEDWSGPFDDLVIDDMGDTDEPMHPHTWGNPLDDMDNDSVFESLE